MRRRANKGSNDAQELFLRIIGRGLVWRPDNNFDLVPVQDRRHGLLITFLQLAFQIGEILSI